MSIEELKELQSKIINKEKRCNRITCLLVFPMLLIILILVLLGVELIIISILSAIVIVFLIIHVIVKAYLHGDDIQIFENPNEILDKFS